jgi:hypothetical protein
MLVVDDYALHQVTGEVGKVIGYGHTLIQNSYLLTLKVLIPSQNQNGKKFSIIEDLASKWMPVQ